MFKLRIMGILLIFVLAIVLLVRCVPSGYLETQSLEDEFLTPSFTNTLILSLPQTKTPTITEKAPTPTLNRQTPTPLLSPTIIPTLLIEEREIYLKGLLKTNANCDLPCWWGIIPGKTTWIESLEFLRLIGGKVSSRPGDNGTIIYDTGGFDFEDIHNKITFFEKSELVETMDVSSEGFQNPVGFQKAWVQYTPKTLITKYGQPSRVWIRSSYSYGLTDRRGYQLWIFYDKLGFLVIYSGIIKKEPIYHICPRFENGEDIQSIELITQTPEDHRRLERFTYYSDVIDYIKPIEKAGLSVEELYSIFIHDEKPCFDIQGNIFP